MIHGKYFYLWAFITKIKRLMGSIQILVFVAIIIFVMYRNAKKEQKKAAKRRMAAPVPQSDVMPASEELKPMEAPQQSTAPTDVPKQKKHRKPSKFTPAMAVAKPAPTTDGNKKTDTPHIRLSNAEEARRAFIYSEIFQRKY